MSNISMTAPNDYSTEMADILRRQKMAELMQQQSMQPVESPVSHGPMGSVTAPISWTQGLAKMLQGYAGNQGQNEATQRQQALAARMRGDRSADYSTLIGGMQGGAISPDLINQLRTPEAQQMALQQGMQQNKPMVLGRSLVNPSGKVLATDSTWQAEQDQARAQRVAEADARRQEAAASQARDQAFRDQQARQAALDRAELAKQTSADRAAMRQPPQVQPLVQIMGPDGQPQWVERQTAIGKVPAGAGSKAEATIAGKETVSGLTTQLRDYYRQLQTGGGITDTGQGGISNIGAGIASSGVGQFAGRMVGTQNQSARNKISQQRPLLLNAIKQATGMSAKQMDSNAELKMYLAAATDPTLDVQANLSALDMIDKLYGTSVGETPQRRATDTKPVGKAKFLGFE